MKYTVTIKTGEELHSGTTSILTLKIVGSQCKTEVHKIDHVFQKPLQRGALDKFLLKDKDVGEIEYLSLMVSSKVALVKGYEDSWYLDFIIVEKDPSDGGSSTFPFYQWITKDNHGKPLIIATNRTCIPHKDTSVRTSDGRRAQQTNKSVEWMAYKDGFPSIIKVEGGHDNLKDRNLQFSKEKKRKFLESFNKVKNNGCYIGLASRLGGALKTFDDFRIYSRDLKHRASYLENDKWKKDEEFGRQILNGTNPVHIKRCRELPSNFPVTSSHVKVLLNRGKTLEEEMEDGRVYIINHDILNDIPTGETLYGEKLKTKDGKIQLAVPLCLFYVREDNKLVPIAIQLGQSPGPDHPIWTPNDEPLDWLLAKIWFINSHMVVHQMVTHLAYTHLVVEPFAVAMHRHLPPCHPVYKLLREHLQYVIAINTIGREKLLTIDGPADSTLSIGHNSGGITALLRKGFSNFDIDKEFNFPNDIEYRDVADIPNYHYRDDGLKLWQAIKEYVSDILSTFYETDDDVQKDKEIQAWDSDVYKEASSKCGTAVKTPDATQNVLQTKDDLITLCTMIIFQSSVKHAAVNNLQWDYLSFAPASPLCMRSNLPTEDDRGKTTQEIVIESLPDAKLCIRSAGIAYALTEFSKDEVFLLQQNRSFRLKQLLKSYGCIRIRASRSLESIRPESNIDCTKYPPRWLFGEERAKIAFSKFQWQLREIENEINERNKRLAEEGNVPYDVLLPSKIPSGIAI